ncbi:MAG: hypothetical protein AAF581_21490 [Planctomycetota bacterium]
MSQLVRAQSTQLIDSLSVAPSSDAEWDRSAAHATLLAEAGNILLRPGAVVDESWQLAATTLRNGSQQTRTAIAERDLSGARAGVETLRQSCATCHRDCGAAARLPWD